MKHKSAKLVRHYVTTGQSSRLTICYATLASVGLLGLLEVPRGQNFLCLAMVVLELDPVVGAATSEDLLNIVVAMKIVRLLRVCEPTTNIGSAAEGHRLNQHTQLAQLLVQSRMVLLALPHDLQSLHVPAPLALPQVLVTPHQPLAPS